MGLFVMIIANRETERNEHSRSASFLLLSQRRFLAHRLEPPTLMRREQTALR